MRRLVFATGTSILHGLQSTSLQVQPGYERAVLSAQFLSRLGSAGIASLSAELSALSLLDARDDDTVALLVTDTAEGISAAGLVQHVAQTSMGLNVTTHVVEGLILDNVQRFRSIGLPSLIKLLDGIIAEARCDGFEPVISVGSGIKAVVPYLSVYAMLRRVDLAYTFERPPTVLWLPRLPVTFDMEAIHAAAPILRRIVQECALPKALVTTALGESFQALEGLFEATDEDQLTLSPFGFLVDSDLHAAAEGQIMLSPNAAATLQRAAPLVKSQFLIMLSRVRNPLWRQSKWHAFRGTDLAVWKPGNTAERMAGWVASSTLVYVAELYSDHLTYERELPTRKRTQYDIRKFTLWNSPDTEAADMAWTSEEMSAERMRSDAEHAISALRADCKRQLDGLRAELQVATEALSRANSDPARSRA